MDERFNRFAPVREGDELDVKIIALGDKGDGIAKKDGFVLVVPGTKVDDEVRVRVKRVLRKVGFAEVIGSEEVGEEKPEEPSEESEETKEEGASEEPEEESEDKPEEGVDSEDFGEDLEETS